MYAKIVKHEALNGLLQPVNIDQGQNEHRVRAVAEFSNSWMSNTLLLR